MERLLRWSPLQVCWGRREVTALPILNGFGFSRNSFTKDSWPARAWDTSGAVFERPGSHATPNRPPQPKYDPA